MGKVNLKGRTALITGASSGIGRATAIALASEGMNLVLAARNIEKLRSVELELKNFNIKALALICDVSDRIEVRNAVQNTISVFGDIDFLICSAGIYNRCPAVDLSLEEIRNVMDVNFYGTLNCIYEALPRFREKKAGHIIVISSLDGKKGLPVDSAYVASKFALTGFMEVMRQELNGTSIQVSSIFPGRIDTPMIANIKTPVPKVPPEKVAKAVVKAMTCKKKEILVPYFSSKFYVVANSISPSFGDWLIRFLKLQGEDMV